MSNFDPLTLMTVVVAGGALAGMLGQAYSALKNAREAGERVRVAEEEAFKERPELLAERVAD